MSELQVTSPSSSISSFPQFAYLAPELRIMVWEKAMEEPRTIPLLHVPDHHIQRSLTIHGVKFIEVPVFFFVNWECRKIAVKQYTEIKARFVIGSRFPDGYNLDLYINFHITNGTILSFHNLKPMFFLFPIEHDRPVNAVWEWNLQCCEIPQVNRWLESLPSECKGENAQGSPEIEIIALMNILQHRPPYFAFQGVESREPTRWSCVSVQNRDEIMAHFWRLLLRPVIQVLGLDS
ncbi:hypothetical protein F5Y12DRAFT_796075 [Xylaria sp. FL1777]|nr:hypothetical protein F5Y12DRAFT_796075 [Xylaria sp. FL1777]